MSSRPALVVRATGKKTNRANRKGKKTKKPAIPRVHQQESRKNQDYMFRHRIGNGRRRVTIQNGGKYNYGVTKCPDSFGNGGRGCPRGNKCKFAHGQLEILYHPLVYKTRECSKVDTRNCEQGSACAWAHSRSELRVRRNILGANWRQSDPTFEDGERMRLARRQNGNGAKRVKIIKVGRNHKKEADASSTWESESVVSRASTMTNPIPMRTSTATPASNESDRMSISVSPSSGNSTVHEEEEKEKGDVVVVVEKDQRKMGMEANNVGGLIRTAQARSEFSCWFRGVFNCEDIRLPFVTYLSRFESSKLDDFSFLFELLCDSHNPSQLADLLVNRIGWYDDASRAIFERELWQYMRPVDPRAWVARRLNLPQYCEIFSDYSSVYIVAQEGIDDGDLLEMGVSSSGHRAKILYYLEKLRLEVEEEQRGSDE